MVFCSMLLNSVSYGRVTSTLRKAGKGHVDYTDIAGDMLDEGEVGFVNSVLDNYAATNR